MIQELHVFTDGGSRGNPGAAGIGVAVYGDKDKIIFEKSAFIGVTTNNVAEYEALLQAMKWLEDFLKQNAVGQVKFFSDSQLLVEQVNGRYKVKQQHLQEYVQKILALRQKITNAETSTIFLHIPREKNKKADALVNLALDAQR